MLLTIFYDEDCRQVIHLHPSFFVGNDGLKLSRHEAEAKAKSVGRHIAGSAFQGLKLIVD